MMKRSTFQYTMGYFIAFVITVMPLLLWTRTETFQWKFIDMPSTFTSIGQMLGLTGIALYACTLILSARLRIFEGLFGGMNRVYIAHHTLGGLAFIFLMVHPLMLAVSYFQISARAAAYFLLPGNDWTINLGQATLLSMMLLLIFTYYIDFPYELWRFTHKFMGFVFFLGGMHMLFVPSDVSRDTPLRLYMIILCGGALVLYMYRTVLGRFLIRKSSYSIFSVRVVGDNIYEVQLTPVKHPIRFVPGQFVFITFQLRGKQETHPFSISSAPNQGDFTLTIKSLGDFTKQLSVLQPGMLVAIEGPYGYFTLLKSRRHEHIWIAGGIGITPFLAMAKALTQDYVVDLYYCVHSESEAVYLPELKRIAVQNSKFQVYPVYSTIHGRLTVDTIADLSGDVKRKEIFLCGPPSMMLQLKKQLRKNGVKREHIHTEEFALL